MSDNQIIRDRVFYFIPQTLCSFKLAGKSLLPSLNVKCETDSHDNRTKTDREWQK